jgi:DNA-binding transcriptional MocR family regulator
MGRDKRNETKGEHFTKLVRNTMETEAWRALSPTAQALYPWLKLEWRGAHNNNNGKIRLSVRQAAERLGVGINTAARAFHDLQAKGFIVVTEHARLGVEGHATSPAFELTEIGRAHSDKVDGRRLYRDWTPGADFPVHKAAVHNPVGGRKKQNPVIKLVTARHQNGDA